MTRLLISSNKIIIGMTNEFPNASADQTFMNRLINDVDQDEHELNKLQIEMLQKSEETQFHPRWVIAIDDVINEKCLRHNSIGCVD